LKEKYPNSNENIDLDAHVDKALADNGKPHSVLEQTMKQMDSNTILLGHEEEI
jgi:hypothetical protein